MDKKILTGIIASLGASLCCITPVLAVLAGSAGLAVGTQRIWPARAFILGHLTHNDLASVRIAKRATKSL